MIKQKSDFINNAMTLLKEKQMIYNRFEGGIFPLTNQPIVLAKHEKSSLPENSTSSESSSSLEHPGNY